MGVKLDWDIEAEKGKHKEHQEDFKERGARYFAFFRLVMVVLIFFGVLSGIVYLILQRLEQVNSRIEQNLTETVQAEVASLRVGDFNGYMAIQRSAAEDWLVTQRETFEYYQQLKTTSNIILSAKIHSVEVDGQRGRVQVQEIIDGIPYLQTWFYWRFPIVKDEQNKVIDEGGWHHVPPDYTFWGQSAQIKRNGFFIRYQKLDEPVAQAVADELERWLGDACSFLACSNLPPLAVDIMNQRLTSPQWVYTDPGLWQLAIPSPYVGRAREDIAFDRQIQIDAATLFAIRLLDFNSLDVSASDSSDAFYLRSAIVTWLVGRFAQVNTESYLITSLDNNYGLNAIPVLLTTLQASSTMDILNTVTGTSIADPNLDWRDFILWRLNTEDELIRARHELAWTQLYDFSDPNLRPVAQSRYNNSFVADERTILEVNRVTAPDGPAQLVARVQVIRGFEIGEEIVVFKLFNGTWLRVN
jgi:hypothetical protein